MTIYIYIHTYTYVYIYMRLRMHRYEEYFYEHWAYVHVMNKQNVWQVL